MKLYDSLSKEFKKIDHKEPINIYNCGPTVYNHIHIGNARPLIVFDVLFRCLIAQNYKVNYLHNLTDIDDKIINEAKKTNQNELELSAFYGNEYAKIRKKLNTLEMKIEKVSDNMDGIINYIERMIDNKSAYLVNGNVYFNTAKVKNYGILSNRQLDEQIHGERVSKDDAKINETDFVLWKKTNEGIQWDTKWSRGRPGWHSECSYLIEKHFNENLTIHGGGIDLKFPHHENENAQHECLHHQGLAKIWVHVGHINVNQQKMSKSLNNFILVKDILEKYPYQTIRWFMYQSNYKNPLDFNDDMMKECHKQVEKIINLINATKSILIYKNQYSTVKDITKSFLDELNNDLNITNSISIIHELIKQLNICIRSKQYEQANQLLNELINDLSILGIEFEDIHNHDNISLINQYFKYVEAKDYEQSDKLRVELVKKGLI